MSSHVRAATLVAALALASACLPSSARVPVDDAGAQSRAAVLELAREDFESARPRLLELASHCRSGEHGRRAVLLLAAAELDSGNDAGSPQAALQLARSYLLLPDAPEDEVVLARALYRLAADLGGEEAAADSTRSAPLVAPRFEHCASAPDLTFRPLPSTSAETLVDREKVLEASLAARADSLARLRGALATSDRRVAELQSELERITRLLTSGAERNANGRP